MARIDDRAIEILHVPINTAGSGDTTLVAAAGANTKIRVLGYVLVAAGTVNVSFKSGASTSLTGAMPLVANTGISSYGDVDLTQLETAANQALVINLSAAIQVSGHLSYVIEA